MSKQIDANITHPNCKNRFDATLHRSIWGEYAANRELVMNDEINVVTCPTCNQSNKLEYPFLYTNTERNFAIWWEPTYDPQIDKDCQGYKKMAGKDHYLSLAPRIKDWNDFKTTLVKYETGELKGSPNPAKREFQRQMKGFLKHTQDQNEQKNKKGCFGVFIMMVVLVFFSIYTGIFHISYL